MQPQHFASHLITQQDSAAGEYLRGAAGGPLDVLIVLGSGLAEALDDSQAWSHPIAAFPLSSVPGLVAPVADGHLDELRIYEHEADDDEVERRRLECALQGERPGHLQRDRAGEQQPSLGRGGRTRDRRHRAHVTAGEARRPLSAEPSQSPRQALAEASPEGQVCPTIDIAAP